ncbi:MAG: hypothetical protein D3910_04895 [Candidatus Electrothrix sp. ATG2]|nr:hypothetical protein [Candidatus Electrothrix sp. ATG2]
MATWSYDAFESISSGRDGVTEMELRVTEKLDDLGPRAEYAKVVMTNVVEGAARAVVYYPDNVFALSSGGSIEKWIKGDVNTIADDSDTERFEEEMYQEIRLLLNSLTDMQAARSKISATTYKKGYSTITVWYPDKIS